MNKSIGAWTVALALVAAIVNLTLFFLWFGLVRVEAHMPPSDRGYTIEALALNITILQVVLALVGFVFATLAFFGYVEIKNAAMIRAEATAQKTAKETANAEMQRFIEQEAKLRRSTRIGDGEYEARAPDRSATTKAEGE